MTNTMQQTMQAAMRLIGQGDLHAATRALQQGLQAAETTGASSADTPRRHTPADLEGQYRVVPDESAPAARAPVPPRERNGGTFTQSHFTCGLGSLAYKLFVPAGLAADAQPPLLMMLHGCTQGPDDFARGTRMNALAQEAGYVVAYPAQGQRRNGNRCWNWFRPQDQQRAGGEAALLAALAQHVVRTEGLDARRVYTAGLSAGGAMAAILAHTHPDVFAAVGVHSGLPFRSAHDVPSAFAAMKSGARGAAPAAAGTVRAIVFHGDRDATVNASNADAVFAQFCTPARSQGDDAPLTVETGSAQGRGFTRRIHSDCAGNVIAEQWILHGAGHAWSGGDASGTYTDPAGPDASAEMLRFFSACATFVLN